MRAWRPGDVLAPDRSAASDALSPTAGLLLALLVVVSSGSVAAASGVGGTDAPAVAPGHAVVSGGIVAQTAGPSATLTASPNPAHPGEAVTLDASGSTGDGGIACDFDYEGDGNFDVFGDGDCVVTHAYAQTGTYQPTVRVRDANQQTDTASTSLPVAENQPPDAAFDVSPPTASVGEPVTFDASASSDPDGTIVAYRWDFDGDGSVDATTSDAVITHAYAAAGSYPVRLEVEDDDGATDTAVFQSVTVEANRPPDAAFDYTPSEPVVGEPATFDASASSDPDGEVVTYRWDFDGDGIFDVETTSPTTDHAFEAGGTHVVTLQVEDDDGATDTAQDQSVTVITTAGGGPQAACSASPRSVAPGEPVTLDASASTGAATVEFDVDGDGTFDETGDANFRTTASYDETGTYVPRARAVGPNGQTAVANCGSIDVGEPNQPPVARFAHERADPDAARVITFDASASSDPDGTVVVYRWDFDGDGRVDATSAAPVVTHEYPEARGYTVVLEVEDDDGATDDTSNPVDIDEGGIPWQSVILVLVGLLGGLGLCRGLALLGPLRRRPPIAVPAGDGVTAYAAGTFALPGDGGTVDVADVGFEPDLVLLTASNAVVAGDATDQVRGTADGWSYGAARRTADGAIDQHVVAVADDAARPDVATAAADADRAIHLAAANDQGGVGGTVGRVERTTPEGFEVAVDPPAGQSNAPVDRPVVLYRAFEVDSPGDVGLGHVAAPTEPGEQRTVLDVPADHVTLVATNALGDLDGAGTVGGAVAVSVGEVVGAGEPRQLVTAGAFVPGAIGRTVTAASDAAAVHLPGLADGAGAASTRARAIRLEDGELALDYETIADSGPVDGSTAPGLVTYVALNAGAEMQPALGHFVLPSPSAEDDVSVDTGFAPGMVELAVVDLDELGERSVAGSPFAFGRSHGVAVRTPNGGVAQHLVSGAVDPDRPVRSVVDADGDGEGAVLPAAEVGEQAAPVREVLVSPSTGAGLAADGAGWAITGRDDVVVTAFRAGGFDVRVTDVSTDGRDSSANSEKLVCYKAWPRVER